MRTGAGRLLRLFATTTTMASSSVSAWRETAAATAWNTQPAVRFASPKAAEVIVQPMFTDNFAYIVIDKETGDAAVVDPGDPLPVIETIKRMDIQLKQLWTTHKHGDHVGGNEAFVSAFPGLQVFGTKYEAVPCLTHGVGEGDEFKLGSSEIKVMHVPCHTTGHVAFVMSTTEGSTLLFAGDTLFVGGCGRFFEGTGAQMLTNMQRLKSLPLDTFVFPAHEYTEGNYKFLASVDADRCGAKYEQIKMMRSQGLFTVPSTIEQELQTNLFMLTDTSEVQALMQCDGNAEATMNTLREQKNNSR